MWFNINPNFFSDKPIENSNNGQSEWITQNHNNNDENRPQRPPFQGRNFRRGPRREGGERHSGSEKTGVHAQSKKEGHGKANWGSDLDAVKDETENMEKLTVESADKNVTKNPGDEVTSDEVKVEEETKKEITLEVCV